MANKELITITDEVDPIEFGSETGAGNFLNRALLNHGENESIEGRVVGPVIDEEGVISWMVLLLVHRHYPDEVIEGI